MKQLSTLDASFLYLESFRTPMHVGGVYIFTPPENGTDFSFEDFRDYVASRLHLAPLFRQRIVEVPLEMGHPYWADDPEFDLEFHLFHMALPKPAGMKELMNIASQSFSRPLDKRRPLWAITVVEGLDNIEGIPKGSFALMPKVHHSAIDGGSGVEMMTMIFDKSPDVGPLPEPKPWNPEKLPSGAELLADSTKKSIKTPLKMAKFITDVVNSTVSNATKQSKGGIKKVKRTKPPVAPFSAPTTLFNVPVTPHRIFAGTEMSLERIKNLKNGIEGLTVNDVILTVCAGALRRYLKEHYDLPKKSLIAMAPISVRTEDEKGKMGNKISAMLVSLGTDEPDPIKRLLHITKFTKKSKSYSKAIKAEKLMDFIPSAVAAMAARMYTRMRISELHKPIYNLVITNVPGPKENLYMNGCRMLKNFGMAPLIDGMGLLITVFSYAGNITIGATSCREIMPDIQKLMDYVDDSLDELEEGMKSFDPDAVEDEKPKRSKKKKD